VTIAQVLLLIPIGVAMMMLGHYLLKVYWLQFQDDPNMTMSWDLIVEAAGVGWSFGRVGALLWVGGAVVSGVAVIGFLIIGWFYVFG